MDWLKKNKKLIFLCLIIIIGFEVRLLAIADIPKGLNVDEASAGYEAYAISNYGIDRNGNYLPVFLESWGSGQNALYSYILIPFIKIFGLTVLSVRLPMAIIGCISLIVMYKLLKDIFDEKIALIGMALLAICPWAIMKSRWGLESNLFPDIILLSVCALIYGLKSKKNIYYIFIICNCWNFSIFLWYIIFFLTTICNTTSNISSKKKRIKHKTINNSICNCWDNYITNSIICYNKQI